MNESITKLRVFRILRTILNFAFWVCLAATIIFIAIAWIKPRTILAPGLSFDGFFLSPKAPIQDGRLSSIYYILVFLVLLVGMVCIWMLKGIANSLLNGSPFIKENVKRIRIMGLALLIQAYLRQFLYYTFTKSLMDTSAITGVSSVLQPRLNLIPESALLALCILILAEIFNFGCTLQHEHDTTV